MTKIKVTTSKRRGTVRKMVKDLPLMLSGRKNDIYGVREAFWSGFAHSLYVAIFRNYLMKSRLEKDELGNSWPDITPETKAYRRSKKSRGKLGPLTSEQKKKWWDYYRKFKAIAYKQSGLSPRAIKSKAASQAWTALKGEGVQTKLQKFGQAKFPVLIDKGNLLASLTPGAFNGTQYRVRNRNQIFNITRSGLELGTRVKYASQHHEPKKAGFPKRRLWPLQMVAWYKNAMQAGVLAATRKFASKL